MALKEADIERLWIQFHRIWVVASDEARAAEDHLHALRQRHREGLGPSPSPRDFAALAHLQQRERHCRAMLDDFETRQRDWRARLAQQPNILS